MKHLLLPAALLLLAAAPACAQPRQQADGARLLEQLEKADANGDGAISRQEFTAYRSSQFDRLDRNHDGFVSDSDIPRRLKNRRPAAASGQVIETFDKNGDGKVSREEFVNGPSPAFDRVDTDGDGVVSKAELQAARTAVANK